MPDTPAVTAQHRTDASAFFVDTEAGPAVCNYTRQGSVLLITHTEVPPALQGRGIAAVLVAATLDWARNERLRVRPVCSYVASYMRRHPEVQDLLDR